MLNQITLNYVAIIAAAFACFAIGGVWYAKPFFGGLWEKLAKQKMGTGKSFPLLLAGNLAGAALTAFALAYSIKYAGATTIVDAISIGFFIWLGFIAATTILGSILWENKPVKLAAIGAGYWLVSILAMSIILTFFP